MNVYPLLNVLYDAAGHISSYIVVEVFKTYEAAYRYAKEYLAQGEMWHDDYDARVKIAYLEEDYTGGLIRSFSEDGRLLQELTVWSEPLRDFNEHLR